MRVLAWPGPLGSENPYARILYGAMAAHGVTVAEHDWGAPLGGHDQLLHVHWPEAPLNHPDPLEAERGARVVLDRLGEARAAGLRVVWTVHNLHPHEGFHPALETTFYRELAGLLGGWLALSATGRDSALAAHPGLAAVQSFVTPHPHYRGAYPTAPGRAEARARLGLGPGPLLLFLGQLRRYKNLPGLLAAFAQLEAPNAALVVAGRPVPPELGPELEALVADPRVRLRLGHVPDAEVPPLLAAADLVALPYRDMLNSGSALLALSHGRPVLAPRRGGLAELAASVGPGWLGLFEPPLSPAHLAAALDAARRLEPSAAPDLSAHAPERAAALTAAAFRAVLEAE